MLSDRAAHASRCRVGWATLCGTRVLADMLRAGWGTLWWRGSVVEPRCLHGSAQPSEQRHLMQVNIGKALVKTHQ